MDLCTNSVVGSGCADAEYADGSFAVHPVISENVSRRMLVVLLDQELHPNQNVYVLTDARAVLDSSGKPFVGLAASDINCAVAEQVIIPNDTVTFLPSEGPCSLLARNASCRIAPRAEAEVLWGKNTIIRKGLQIGHIDCPNAGLDKSRADMKGNLDFIFATKCLLDDILEVLANNRRWQGVRTRQISNVDLVLPSGPTCVDPSQTSFFQLHSIGTKMVGPSLRDRVGSRHRCSRGRSVGLLFLSHISGGGHIPSYVRHRCVHVELHR